MYLKNIKFYKLILIVMLFSYIEAKRDLPTYFEELRQPVKAENFILKDMDGKNVSLSDFSGKIIVLNFWATWCPPCKEEMPSIQNFYIKNKNKNIIVIAVAVGQNEDDVFPFVSEMEPLPTFQILLDEKSSVSRLYGVHAMPTTFLINTKGYITHYAIGARNFNSEEFINTIFK